MKYLTLTIFCVWIGFVIANPPRLQFDEGVTNDIRRIADAFEEYNEKRFNQ